MPDDDDDDSDPHVDPSDPRMWVRCQTCDQPLFSRDEKTRGYCESCYGDDCDCPVCRPKRGAND